MKSELLEGMRVVRAPLFPSHDQSSVRRLANYGSFALAASLVGQKRLRSADVAVVYSSPATAAFPAMVASGIWRTPFVLIVQDLWPESVLQSSMAPTGASRTLLRQALESFDRVSNSMAAHILVTAPGMKRALVARGVSEEKISVMFNWAPDGDFLGGPKTGELRGQLGLTDDDLLFLYGGNLGEAQGLLHWIEGIARVQDLKHAHFAFMGSGIERQALMSRAMSLQLANVSFPEPVSSTEFARLSADADAFIISLRDAPLFAVTIPSKIQFSLAMGRAVVATVNGDAAEILIESGAGLVSRRQDVAEIETLIRQAVAEGKEGLEKRGGRGHEFYHRHMSESQGIAKLVETINSVAGPI